MNANIVFFFSPLVHKNAPTCPSLHLVIFVLVFAPCYLFFDSITQGPASYFVGLIKFIGGGSNVESGTIVETFVLLPHTRCFIFVFEIKDIEPVCCLFALPLLLSVFLAESLKVYAMVPNSHSSS